MDKAHALHDLGNMGLKLKLKWNYKWV